MSDATRSLLHLRNNPPKAKFGSKHKNGTFGMKLSLDPALHFG